MPPETDTPETPTPPSPELAPPPAPERVAILLLKPAFGCRDGDIVRVDLARAAAEGAVFRLATPDDFPLFGREPAEID